MRAHLAYYYHRLSESFWFLPSLITLFAVLLSVGTLTLDRHPPEQLYEILPWSAGLDRSNARLIISTISGSIITAASLVFSLTLVALTLAASQLGPRLLSMFMRDRLTQVVLGSFVGTFVFTLLILASLGDTAEGLQVPRASIFAALLLTLLSFALLIAFIHRLSSSLNAEVVVARLAQNLETQLSGLLSEKSDDTEPESDRETAWDAGASIASARCGYLQAVDSAALVEVACEHDTEIRLLCRPGHFLQKGESIAEVRDAPEDLEGFAKGVRGALVFGRVRTDAEDPEYAVRAIVEIALRALSPGVNDPYTAVTCTDWLGERLRQILTGQLPARLQRDDSGAIRLRRLDLTVGRYFDAAFNDLRQSAEGNVSVLIRIAETLARLDKVAEGSEARDAILRHSKLIARACKRSVPEEEDREDMQERLEEIGIRLAE